MAKLTIYLTDELAWRVKEAAVPISKICQAALVSDLVQRAKDGDAGLDGLQLHGQACIDCGAVGGQMTLQYRGPNEIALMRCTPYCDLGAEK